MSIARDLAEFLIRTRTADLPAQAADYATMLIASTLASAAAGTTIGSAQIVRDLARERGGTPQASLWFDGGAKLPITDAARANALTSDAAASDDSDLRNIVHCGTPLVATSLAIAEQSGASGADVLGAIVLGYELAGRINDATPGLRPRGFHGCCVAAFAATGAAGRLLGLDAEQMTHAICLTATSVGGLVVAADTSVAREYHAGAVTSAAIDAARAARRGYTCEETVLEAPKGFFALLGGGPAPAGFKAGLGESWDIVTDMAVKLVPGGHPYHALAEAAANAARDANIAADEIESITVSRPGMTALTPPLHPVDLIGMAHSPAYFTAAGAADHRFSWVHCTPEKIADPVIHRLIDKVRVGPEPTESVERYRQGATATIRTRDGRTVTNTVFAPKGSGMLGIDWADIDAKYRALMPFSGLAGERIEQSLSVIHDFRRLANVAPLIEVIRSAP